MRCMKRNPDFRTTDSDGIFGFHAGAQWQWGAWVLGAEAALSGCFNECRSTTVLPGPPFFNPNNAGEHKITNLFTVGPRLGYAWDRLMIFATGGYASADLKGTYCSTVTGICGPGFTNQNGQSRNNGWYAGGGLRLHGAQGPSGANTNTSTWARRMRSSPILPRTTMTWRRKATLFAPA